VEWANGLVLLQAARTSSGEHVEERAVDGEGVVVPDLFAGQRPTERRDAGEEVLPSALQWLFAAYENDVVTRGQIIADVTSAHTPGRTSRIC